MDWRDDLHFAVCRLGAIELMWDVIREAERGEWQLKVMVGQLRPVASGNACRKADVRGTR
jgi:hypothetical protein